MPEYGNLSFNNGTSITANNNKLTCTQLQYHLVATSSPPPSPSSRNSTISQPRARLTLSPPMGTLSCAFWTVGYLGSVTGVRAWRPCCSGPESRNANIEWSSLTRRCPNICGGRPEDEVFVRPCPFYHLPGEQRSHMAGYTGKQFNNRFK